MSMRVKAALILILIIFVLTAANFFSSLFFTRQSLIATIEQDMSFALDIADNLVSTKIGLLKSDAATVAERLLKAGSNEEMAAVMASQINEFPNFLALTVFDRENIISHYGEPISPIHLVEESCALEMTFGRENLLSPPHYNLETGSFIMHVFVPMGPDKILSATIPGLLFVDLLSSHRLWRTGSLIMTDGEGTIIANFREDLVLNRRNFIEDAKTMPEFQTAGDFIQKMISSDKGSGIGTYYFEKIKRLCTYKRITASKSNWSIGVVIPLPESPESKVRADLLVSSLVFLAAGIIASVFISNLAVRPFNKIKAQNSHLENLNEAVQAASEAKSSFLAHMSHEMRTPLNAIIGLSDLTLELGELNEESYLNLEKIYNSGMTLLGTVNDILDISKIEAGKLELVPVEYDVPSLINDIIIQNILRIGEKPIAFILDLSEDLPSRLYGDELRIKQIFSNLLSNAFKYTKVGEVVLSISCAREGGTVWMTSQVRDTGIGLRPEDLKRLFTDYIQIDLEANRRIEGTGLGLHITKRLLSKMDGDITVESEYGKGSVFTVKLRQEFVTDSQIGPEVVKNLKNFRYTNNKRLRNSRLSRLSLPYARVLVVDDLITNLDVAKGLMKPYNLQIDCVTSGQEAIDAIRAEKVKYNAVFMDQMMPGIDGIEATRLIREIGTEYAGNLPIIALTANAIRGSEEMFLSKGFQDFLSKPIDIPRLDAILRKWVRNKKLEEELLKEGQVGEQPEKKTAARRLLWPVDGLDLSRGLERFGGDEESYLEVLRSFAANTRPLLEKIKGPNEDGLDAYTVIVHGLKSSSRGIGADQAGSQAEALEKAAKAGEFEFLKNNTPAFIEAVERLLTGLEDLFGKIEANFAKPRKDRPDVLALSKLLAACENYDMDGVDAAMAEIEAFEYESDDGLAAWLRMNVDHMNFAQIKEKLSA